MALNETEIADIKRCMGSFMKKRRPPAFVRDEVDLQYYIIGNEVIISRVNYINNKKYDSPLVKIVLNRPHTKWNIYSMIPPNQWIAAIKEPIQTFSDAIKVVENDDVGIFFG
ncbi:DUF3024 domain-containing protein [Providencia rettgeri]|uniref:DUF3024 domain-containing protein n=1 Tax=Providencia sp. PROV148 TaxID=2949858 RepID=UPI00234A4858|nr:hypothetical protein [Providencia sp. PROV148]ELR5232166.1 hypothetical protein [Providencia rettgeri]